MTNPRRILIIDDHALIRDGLRLTIEQEKGFEVIGDAGRPDEALQSIERLRPDILLMDVQLEQGDGIDLSARVLARWPEVRILVLSAFSDAALIDSALKAGARGFLGKSNAASELMRALRAVAEGGSYFCPVASAAIVKNYRRPTPPPCFSPATGVTRRERDVWKLTAEGLRVKEIAGRLNIGVKTVETHRAQLLKKLNCSGTAELTRRAIQDGLCPL